MCGILTRPVACALILLTTASRQAIGQRAEIAPPGAQAQPAQPAGDVLIPQAGAAAGDLEAAGLPPEMQPAVLTWHRAYTQALVRYRVQGQDGDRNLAPILDTKRLDELGGRVGVVDFDRFRKGFLSTEKPFADPSRDVLDLLRRLQRVANTRQMVSAQEQLVRYLEQRVEATTSGLSRLEVDRAVAGRAEARRRFEGEQLAYRDRLDQVRVSLGLAPGTPVVPDPDGLAGFRLVFAKVQQWSLNPRRRLDSLASLAEALPPLGEIEIEGRPVLAAIDRDPGRLEGVLNDAAQTATRNRGQVAEPHEGARDIRIRRQLRHLSHTSRSYQLEKGRYVLAIRLADQAMDRLLAPPSPASVAGTDRLLQELLEQESAMLECQNRLIDGWTSFRVDRLSFYRDLGTLPYNDWAAFYQQFSASAATVLPLLPAPGPDVPAPPAPPAPPEPPVPQPAPAPPTQR